MALNLAWVGRLVSRRGGALILVSPQPEVARLLDTTGASKVVTVCDSVRQASVNVAVCPPVSA